MVTVLSEKVIGGSKEFFRRITNNSVNLGLCGKRKAVEDLALEGATWGFGLGLRPVYAGHTAPIVASVGIFFAVYDNA